MQLTVENKQGIQYEVRIGWAYQMGIPMQVDANHLLSMFDDAVIEKIHGHFFGLGGNCCNLLSTNIQAGTSGTIFLGPLSEPPGHLSHSEKEIYSALVQNRLIIEESHTAASAIAVKQSELMLKIRLGLQQIIAQERAESARIQEQHEKRSTIGKVGAYIGSAASGFGDAAWGLAVWTKDILEVAEMLSPLRQSHRLGVATVNYFIHGKSFEESGQQYLSDLEREAVDVLGFDPSKITKQQLELAVDVAQIIYDDLSLREIIIRFAEDYVKAQHSLEVTKLVGGGAFEIVLTIVLAAITGGVGAAVAVVKNARLLRAFKKLGELMMEFAKLKKLQQRVLKKRGGKAKGSSASFSDLSSSEVTVPQKSSGPSSSNSSSATSSSSSQSSSSSGGSPNSNSNAADTNTLLPPGAQSVQERIAQGKTVPRHARVNPEGYYYDSSVGKYKTIPEPKPDLSKGSGNREIPCFGAGTLVATPDSFAKIEDIKIGTLVSSWDENLKKVVENRVTALHRNKAVDWVEIVVSGSVITATCNHRFWMPKNEEWIEARFLDVGMEVLLENGQRSNIDKISLVTSGEKDTFNITVENAHTYYVGSSKVLVHNDGSDVNGKVYIGYNKSDSPIYVGQTLQTIKARQAQHTAEGIADPVNKGWKTEMTIKQYPGLDGLTPDQMNYHERRIYDQLIEKGIDLKNSQIPLTDPKVNKLIKKYC
ncbi:Hint domain-containing protein [Microbulbifer sp. TRSA001]|uniref:Hint domain-containing protein n=1 Tax=Microbulbifer sp. TRSA001 TaxID=3243381 RepID=UPI0040394AA9